MIEINGEKKLHFHIFIPNLQRGCHHLFSVFGSNFHMNLTHMVLDGQIFTQKSLPKIPSYRSKIYGRYSAFANTIYVCLDKNYNIFQTTRFNHTMIFFKLTD